ncbi:MAG TPA: hypothetical protein VES36_06525 [Candidatus Limnocylindrales bacterium]|nr:hypothetical protein [Candidatus Limnocylindrales bacterium]
MINGIVLACLLVVCAQDKPTPEEAFGPQASGSPEVEALVERVKAQLAAVDAALQAAAEADKAASDLTAARQAHLSVIRDIEELIKQVKYSECQTGQAGGKPNSKPQDGKPQPQQSPPDPRESDGQEHSEPKPGNKPPQAKPKDGQPESGEPNAQPPATTPGDQPPPPPETGRFDREDTDARWGLLPPKIQERLMNLHVDDLPERYRVWMDAYIRQLNRLEQGASPP